jgi:hypothetical protein
VKTFVLQDGSLKRRKGVLIARWCVWFLFIGALYAVVDSIWPRPTHSVPQRLFSAIWLASILSFFLMKGSIQSAKPESITIYGDMIVTNSNGKFRKMFLGDIRTVVETQGNLLRDGGLLVSDKSLFKARFLGRFLWIPEGATDYDYLKSVVEMRAKVGG